MTRPTRLTRREFAKLVSAGPVFSGIAVLPRETGGRTTNPGPDSHKTGMRVTAFARKLSEDHLRYIKQIGADDIRLSAPLVPGYERSGYLELDNLLAVKRKVEELGLRLSTLYLSQLDLANLLLDKPGWEKALDNVCRTIECLGKASVPVLAFSLLASRAIRSTTGKPIPGYWLNPNGRGGAVLHSFDEERARQATEQPAGLVSADQMWERITRFQKRCVPVAHEAQVHLACHPDDPPIARHWGVSQVLNSKAGLNRLIEIVPSPYNGLLLCLGTMQESGADVLDLIRHFGGMKKIFDIDFRAVHGTVPKYDEVFLDQSDLDMWKVVRTLKEVGYEWTLEPDHVPGIIGDTPETSISYAWAVGYIKGLLAGVNGPAG
ncbi:MAG: TIM barrel protein [Acidimicrobiia bacterium]|nr:TIM barrel protein [Acidimicrobiia bacterium]